MKSWKSLVLASVLVFVPVKHACAGLDEGVAAYLREDYATSLGELVPQAQRGNAIAQFYLGLMSEHGEGVAQDDAQAAEWYRRAADQGHAKAQNNLGVLYRNGQGVQADDQEAVKWLRAAAMQGSATAQFNLGVMYHYGRGVQRSYAEAVRWYRRAADQGLGEALNNLGVMYRSGHGVPQDDVRAHAWYSLAASRLPAGKTRELATSNLAHVARAMTPAQLAEAHALAREWSSGVERLAPTWRSSSASTDRPVR